jgi:hypothetical protein
MRDIFARLQVFFSSPIVLCHVLAAAVVASPLNVHPLYMSIVVDKPSVT